MPLPKYVTYQAVTLPDMEPVVATRSDSGGILASMLQDCQRIINSLVNRSLSNDSYDPAHELLSLPIIVSAKLKI
jgi:hypothetical protein